MTAFISRFGFPIILLMLAVLAITGNLFSASPLVIAGQLLGLVINAVARSQFRKTNFRFTAEPAGEGLLRTGIILWRVEVEETLLRGRYPEFGDYAASTKRLIPYIY